MSEIYNVTIDALVGNFRISKTQDTPIELDDSMYDFDYLVKTVENIGNKIDEMNANKQ